MSIKGLQVRWWTAVRLGLLLPVGVAWVGCGDAASVPEPVGTAEQRLGTYGYTDHVPWSQSPPAGLTSSHVPMFVQIGFDDNFRSSGMNWATDFLRALRNPAGASNASTFD